MEVTCLVFASERLSAPCAKCGSWPEKPHVTGEGAQIAVYCPECCPVHNPNLTFLDSIAPISGEQDELFG